MFFFFLSLSPNNESVNKSHIVSSRHHKLTGRKWEAGSWKQKNIMVTVQQPVERISAPHSFKICRPADLNSEQPAGVSV